MDGLVQKLSQGWHPVMLSLRPDRSLKAFRECLDRGYIHVKFINTQGGTELGIAIDRNRSDFSSADFNTETGQLTLVGVLRVNYVAVQCTATIDLPQLEGIGHLEPVPE